MRKVGLILGLALVAFACSEQAGQMLVDAGEMMMGASVPDAGAQPDEPTATNATCDHVKLQIQSDHLAIPGLEDGRGGLNDP